MNKWSYCNTPFPTCPHRQSAGKHCLRADRHIHRHPETGVHQRRIDACLLRRYRSGIVYRHFSHSVGSLVCSFVRFRCRVAQQTKGYAGRLCHCRILDIGHGIGHYVHFPLAGIRTRLVRLSLRQHSHDYLERHRSIGRACPAADTVFALYLHPIIYVAFDREFARSQGIPVQVFEYALMMFIALTIVACLRMVGIVLVISLLTVPQMTANLFSHRFHRIIWLSIGIGYLSCLGGLMISFYLNVPSGASIIFFSIIIYAICKTGKSFWLYLQR